MLSWLCLRHTPGLRAPILGLPGATHWQFQNTVHEHFFLISKTKRYTVWKLHGQSPFVWYPHIKPDASWAGKITPHLTMVKKMKRSLTYIALCLCSFALLSCTRDDSCVENSTQCSKSGIPQKCINETWVDQEACKDDLVCSLGDCVRHSSGDGTDCSGYKKKCSDDGRPMVCTDGKWQTFEPCEEPETCIKGSCQKIVTMSCINNTIQCKDDKTPQLCKNGEWTDKNTCTGDNTCKKGRCSGTQSGACSGNAKNCSDEGIPQVCDNGQWSNQSGCDTSTQKCLDGTCVSKDQSECIEYEKDCKSDEVPMICQNGSWKSLQPCEKNWKCIKGSCLPNYYLECGGSSRCTYNGFVQSCELNHWADTQSCEDTQKCLDGHCVPFVTPECMPESTKCSKFGGILSCVDGQWTDIGQCDSATEYCFEGACYNINNKVCEDGETTCKDDLLVTCLDGRWNNGRSCPAGERCLKNKCVSYNVPDCTGTETRCSPAGIAEICQNNKWEIKEICGYDKVCQDGNCVSNIHECIPSECASMPDDSYLGNVCTEHAWTGISCGCERNEDCREHFRCNTHIGYCAPDSDVSFTDSFEFLFPKTASCEKFRELNHIMTCTQTDKKFNITLTNQTNIEIISSNISNNMANLKAPNTEYYIDFSNIHDNDSIRRVVEIVWQHGSSASQWEQSKLKITDDKSKTKVFMANAQNTDMTSIFIPDGIIYGFKLEGTGPNVVKVKSIKVRPLQPSDENPNTPEWCASKPTTLHVQNDPTAYTGNICMDQGCQTCGCSSNNDCNNGYQCNTTTNTCYDVKSEECANKQDKDYFGSYFHPTLNKCTCETNFWDGQNNHSVEIPDGSYTCRSGYTCNPDAMLCSKNDAPKTITIDFLTKSTCSAMQSIPGNKNCSVINAGSNSSWMQIWFENLIFVSLKTEFFNYC